MTNDYIRKHDAVKASLEFIVEYLGGAFDEGLQKGLKNNLESIEPADVVPTESQEIGYGQCANVLLKMWMDNVVTDGEYNRIMDRLNKLYFSGGEREE